MYFVDVTRLPPKHDLSSVALLSFSVPEWGNQKKKISKKKKKNTKINLIHAVISTSVKGFLKPQIKPNSKEPQESYPELTLRYITKRRLSAIGGPKGCEYRNKQHQAVINLPRLLY